METTLKKIELTDSLIGINKLGTYHGYMNPDNYFDSYMIDQDYFYGEYHLNSDQFWEKFDHGMYTDLIAKQIDNLLPDLVFEINYLFETPVLNSIGCVGIDSPKYYNYRDDWYLLDFYPTEDFTDQLLTFAERNKEEFNEFLEVNYSSCDGFISYTSNNYNEWRGKFLEGREQEIGAILSYLVNWHLDFDFVDHCLQNFEIYYWDCINE